MKVRLKWPQIGFEGMVTVARFAYNNNAPAIVLYDEEGEELTRASTNIPEHADKLKENQTFLKVWSENEGLMEALQEAGIVGKPLFWVPTGYVQAPAVEILV